MKLNKCFTTFYLLVFNALYHPHTFINLSPYLYFPFPTESRKEANRMTKVMRFFCAVTDRRKLAFRRGGAVQKNGFCVSRMPLCFSFDDGPRRKGKSLAEA